MRLTDKSVASILDNIKKLNWNGFKLFLVGGLLEDWDTRDIDVVITGDGNYKLLFDSMEKARLLGPIDFYYIKDENNLIQDRSKPFTSKFAKSYDKGHSKAKQRPGEWKDGLFWMEYTFPPIHFETNKKYKNQNNPLLIHDGNV